MSSCVAFSRELNYTSAMRFTVQSAGSNDLGAAFRMLAAFRPLPDRDRAAERYRDLFASGELDPAGLFVARDEADAIRGAILVQVMPGALGLTWPPVTERRNRAAIEDALVSGACDWLRSRGVKVCQAFASELERDSLAALVRHGFRHVAQLLDMKCEPHSIIGPDSRVTFEPVGLENRAEFAATMLASYEGSLDCPESTGCRTDAELLEGIADPAASKEHWFLARVANGAVGVVLLDGDNEPGTFELTYLGLKPNFRGRGLGRELMRFALFHAENAGGSTVVLSVDARNEPAIRLYRTHEFQASGEREVFLAAWPTIS